MKDSTRQIVALLGGMQARVPEGKRAALKYEQIAALLKVDLIKAKRMVHAARDEGMAMIEGGPGKGKKAKIYLSAAGIAAAKGAA